MWKNFIKIAWRQLFSKAHLSIIKIIGLGLGIAAYLLLLQYISWQWNFDRFHHHAKDIVRIQNDHFKDGVLNSQSAMTASGVPVIAKENFPQVIDYVRLGRWIANDVIFRYQENLYRGDGCFFTDPAFFDVFSFEMILGDPKTALKDPNSLVLTETTAKKLFANENPMGKEVLFENFKTFQITGIVKNPPSQSHIQFDLLGSLSTMTNWRLDVYADDEYSSSYVYAYLKTVRNADLKELEQELTTKVGALKPHQSGNDVYKLQPLQNIHLYSDLDNEIGATGQGNNIWILSGIALLILILGWVNHFNLFVASTMDQTQSISIRKIVGATRQHIFTQIAISSFIYSAAGILLGFILATIAQPVIEKSFAIPFGNISLLHMTGREPSFYLFTLLLLGTFGNAFLPAIFMSRIRPAELLHRSIPNQPRVLSFRKVLVTSQFIIITGLIACTAIIYQQASFIKEKDLGITLDNIKVIRAPLGVKYEELAISFPAFKEEVMAIPGVEMLSVSHRIPGNELELIENLKMGEKEYIYSFYRNYGDPTYLELYDMQQLSAFPEIDLKVTDKRYAVINKMAAELLGFFEPEEAVGMKIERWEREVEILGVVDNYHQRSLHHATFPIIYDFSSDGLMSDGYYSIKVSDRADISLVQTAVREAFEEAFPYTIFEFADVEDHFNSQYKADDNFRQLNLGFTLLALIIAGLGLLGLIMITLERRLKEMSIRKVLGASASNLVFLLSKDILGLTLIAGVIATPISWYLMSRWLNHFSTHIEIGWVIFVGAATVVALISLVIVGVQTLRASITNPAKTLRDE
ncbi:MAG: FtsX-like permease family protein [Saprospiraceae bacterium]|nr:FtsX-like permease family protein [Saprospiraceae bacterium]